MKHDANDAWAAAADAHALGEGPAPGPAPDAASRAEEQLFAALPAMATPVALEGDALLAEQLLDQAPTPAPAPAASAVPKLVVAGGLVLVAVIALLNRPSQTTPVADAPNAAPESPTVAPPTAPAPPAPEPVVEAPAAAPVPATPPETPSARAAPAPKKSEGSGLSAAELLARARAKRGEGDKRGAEKLYRQLMREHPSSPEAHASRISLGQLQLSLGKAKSALGSFRAYKRKGGPLLEEAHWGIVRSLDRLGRDEERNRAIGELEARFPSSAYRAQAAKLEEGK